MYYTVQYIIIPVLSAKHGNWTSVFLWQTIPWLIRGEGWPDGPTELFGQMMCRRTRYPMGFLGSKSTEEFGHHHHQVPGNFLHDRFKLDQITHPKKLTWQWTKKTWKHNQAFEDAFPILTDGVSSSQPNVTLPETNIVPPKMASQQEISSSNKNNFRGALLVYPRLVRAVFPDRAINK